MVTVAMAFDTHTFVKKLTAAGMPEQQAEILAAEQTYLIENRLTSKQDIGFIQQNILTVKKELGADIEKVCLEMDLKLAKMKSELIHWILGASTAQAAFVFSVFKLFH